MKESIAILLGLSFIFWTTPARALDFKEGRWSMTMVTKMDNMSPQMAAAMQQMQNMPPEARAQMEAMEQKMGVSMSANGQGMTMTTTQCLTKQNPVPSHVKSDEQQYCQETHDTEGNTVNFKMTCNHSNMQMESSGSMTYSGDSMQGHIKSHTVNSGRPMDSDIDITGQYMGPCS